MIVPNVARYQIVRRIRRRMSRCNPLRDEVASIAKAISGAAHSLDQLVGKLVVYLSAQAPHQHLEHVGKGIMILIPDVCGDRGSVDHLSMVQHEKLEQRKLFCGELDGFSTATDTLSVEIYFQIGHCHCLRQRRAASSAQRSNTRQQFAERKADRLAQLDNPQVLLNPEVAAALQQQFAGLGPQGDQAFGALLGAIRFGLVDSLHGVFLLGTLLAGLGLVTVLFLQERPLRKSFGPPTLAEGALADTAAQVGYDALPSLPPLRPEDEPRLKKPRNKGLVA